MRHTKIAITIAILLTSFVGCGQSQEEARIKLGQLNIAYSEDAFVEHVSKGDKVVVALFLRAGMRPETGFLPAAKKGYTDIITVLLDEGADPKSEAGAAALVVAADHEHYDICMMLVGKGANINAKYGRGDVTALLAAAGQEGSAEFLRFLINKGADVNATTTNHSTTLMLAASDSNSSEVVRILLEKGADVNAANKDGITALANAVRYGHKQIVQILIASGADVNSMDRDYGTYLHHARKKGHTNIVILLKEAGAIDLQKATAVCSGYEVNGIVTFTISEQGLRIIAEFEGLPKGDHGLDIHNRGDCGSPDFRTAGSHEIYIDNIKATDSGVAKNEIINNEISLDSIIGKSVILHSWPIDPALAKNAPRFWKGGARLSCGVIRWANLKNDEGS